MMIGKIKTTETEITAIKITTETKITIKIIIRIKKATVV